MFENHKWHASQNVVKMQKIYLMVTPHPSHFIVHIFYMHVMHLLFILQDLV